MVSFDDMGGEHKHCWHLHADNSHDFCCFCDERHTISHTSESYELQKNKERLTTDGLYLDDTDV